MAELAESDREAARVTAEDLGKRLREKAANKTPLLATYVEECDREGLFQKFGETDRLALRMQASHKSNARLAILFGGLATLVGLATLRAEPSGLWLWGLELALFLASACFVVVGLLSFRKEAWLTIRYQAERYRLLAFGLLIDPALWTRRKPGPGGWREFFAPAVQRIGILPREDPQALACAETFPTVPAHSDSEGAEPAAVRDLGQFYRDTIIAEQIAYFRKKKDLDSWVVSPRLPSVAFTVITVLVCFHLAFAFTASQEPRGSRAGIASQEGKKGAPAESERSRADILDSVFLEASLVAAIVWAGIRNWLAANEFSRNAFRAQARLKALVECQGALDEALKVQRITNSGVDSWRVFATLALCQAQLEAEQREWLRLMVETEWY